MTTISVYKNVEFPITKEWLRSLSEQGRRGTSLILKRGGKLRGLRKCFIITCYDIKLLKRLLLNSGYILFVAAKYFGTGEYLIRNNGKPITRKRHKMGGKLLPDSIRLGRQTIEEQEVRLFEKDLSLLRGTKFNKNFEFGHCNYDPKNAPKIMLERKDLLDSRVLMAGDPKIIELTPKTNFIGLEDSIKGDLLLSWKLREYNFLSPIQKHRITEFYASNTPERLHGKINGRFFRLPRQQLD